MLVHFLGVMRMANEHDVEPVVAGRRIVEVAAQQEGERFAGQRIGIERGQETVEIERRERPAPGFLERPHVHHDAQARDRHERMRPLLSRPISSSARSWTTMTSASTTMRRDILL